MQSAAEVLGNEDLDAVPQTHSSAHRLFSCPSAVVPNSQRAVCLDFGNTKQAVTWSCNAQIARGQRSAVQVGSVWILAQGWPPLPGVLSGIIGLTRCLILGRILMKKSGLHEDLPIIGRNPGANH